MSKGSKARRERRRLNLVPARAVAYLLGPRYAAALARHLDAHPPPAGAITEVVVTHDDGCRLWLGIGPCTCEPTILSRRL
jgi:hypothetical protein